MSVGTSGPIRASRALVVAFLVIGCGALVTTTAWAQGSIVVGGSLTVLGNPSNAAPVWTLVGDGISVLASGGDSGSPGGAECTPCRAGRTIGMGGTFAGTTLGSGQAVVNGVLVRPVFFAGNLTFHANSAVMPDFDGNSWRNVTVPFDMGTNSFLQGYADVARTQLLFTIRPVIGRGTVTLHLDQFVTPTGPLYDFRSVTYTFGPGLNLNLNLLQKLGLKSTHHRRWASPAGCPTRSGRRRRFLTRVSRAAAPTMARARRKTIWIVASIKWSRRQQRAPIRSRSTRPLIGTADSWGQT